MGWLFGRQQTADVRKAAADACVASTRNVTQPAHVRRRMSTRTAVAGAQGPRQTYTAASCSRNSARQPMSRLQKPCGHRMQSTAWRSTSCVGAGGSTTFIMPSATTKGTPGTPAPLPRAHSPPSRRRPALGRRWPRGRRHSPGWCQHGTPARRRAGERSGCGRACGRRTARSHLGAADRVDAAYWRPLLIRAWVPVGGHDHRERGRSGPLQPRACQAASGSIKERCQQVRLEPHHEALALGVAEAHVVLEQLCLRARRGMRVSRGCWPFASMRAGHDRRGQACRACRAGGAPCRP